jgi:transposase
MGRPLPQELRDRVVGAWKQGKGSTRELAQLFDLGEATVNRWVARYNKTGSAAPLPHAGGQTHRIPAEILPVLEALVKENPDLTRAEYGELLFRETGAKAAMCTIGRGLKRLGYTRKKSLWSPPSSSRSRGSGSGRSSSRRSPSGRTAASS